MNYGLYTAASGLMTNLYRMDVYANNLANAETVGFKPDTPVTRARQSAKEEDGLDGLPSNELLERLGAGVLLAPNRVSMAQGSLKPTDNPLDLAISGDGYLVVSRGPGTGDEYLRLTRDGRLARDGQGRLVQAATGLPVLDSDDGEIKLPDGSAKVEIGPDGWLTSGGTRVAKIQVAMVSNPASLRKEGENLLAGDVEMIAHRKTAAGVVKQGYVERSATDPVRAMLSIAEAERGVSGAAKLIQMHDELMNRAINTFARVA